MEQQPSQSWEQMIGRIDRRYVYLGLFLFTLIPLLFRVGLPVFVTPPAQNFHDTVEGLPTDKVVFVSSNWDAGTYAENEPQTIALFRHLLRRKLKFVIFSVGSQNAPQLTQNALDAAIQADMNGTPPAGSYPVYGTDYANMGFKIGSSPWTRSLVRDPGAALKGDWKGKPVKDLPIFQNIKSMPASVSLLVDVSASATTPRWIALVGSEGVPLALACTAVMAPEQYPYLATRQLTGMLTGMRGAAEYEKLLNIKGRATTMMGGQSFAHLYVFILIAIGNVAVLRGWMARRRV